MVLKILLKSTSSYNILYRYDDYLLKIQISLSVLSNMDNNIYKYIIKKKQ